MPSTSPKTKVSKTINAKKIPLQAKFRHNKLTLFMVMFLTVCVGIVLVVVHATARPAGKLSPAAGLYWGMTTNYSGDIAGRETQLERKLGIHNMFFSWTDHFPSSAQTDDVANGRVPMVTWEPWNTTLASIAGGAEDTNIIAHAQAIKAFDKPLMLRFAHEMNGNWYPWSGPQNGADTTGSASYIAAWRHVHDIFVTQGATNVAWVWAPNVTSSPATAANNWKNYYPGDSYVDWVGVDGYNWGTSNGGWRAFASLFGNGLYADYASTKPIMIAETASSEAGGNKAQWITDMGSSLKTSFPSVEAVLWFDKSGTADNWTIDSSPASLSAYKSIGLDTYFGGPGISDLVVSGISWTPASPTNGNQVLFSATIKNQGTASTPAGATVGLAWYIDGLKTNFSSDPGPIAPGDSRTLTSVGGPGGASKYWTAISGSHSIRALVDDVNRFSEFSDTNNDLTLPITPTSTPAGLSANYFKNTTLTGPALTRTDATINFTWGGNSPMSGIATDNFSARWTGYVTAPATGAYTFFANTDDGERLWVNNQQLINNWIDHGAKLDTATISVNLTAGQKYPIKMEYYDHAYSATAQLLWQGPGITQQIIPASVLSH